MSVVAYTERLVLRDLCDTDARELLALNSDPEVLRYTGDEPFADFSAALEFVQDYDHYRRHGFGRWAITLRQTQQFAGYCGLNRNVPNGPVNLEFRVHRRYWSQGIATEAGKAALRVGFEQYRLPVIFSRALRENLPSITVLQKLGLTFREVAEEDELIWLVYAIRSTEFTPVYTPQPEPEPTDP